jgi:hypothetical protein
MSRTWFWPAVVVVLAAGPAAAQQPASPLELVRGLRAAGMPDLALEYLRESENKPMPENDRKAIPLERARCLLETAEEEADEGTRTSMIGEAKEAFNDFILHNPTHPRAAEASLSLARLTSVEARAQLNRARRMELPARDDPGYDAAVARKREEGDKARPLFLVASQNFDAAAKQIKAQLEDKTLDPRTRQSLEQEASDAELAAAINQYHLAETFLGANAALAVQRGEFLEKARSTFAKLASGPQNTHLYWVAQAWKAEVLMDQSKANEADTIFKDILASTLPEAEEGKRMVRFFQIRRSYQSAVEEKSAAKLQAVEKELRAWLAKYANPRKPTPESLSVQFYLALVLQRQAEIAIGPPPKDPSKQPPLPGTARRHLEEAEKLYRALGQSDNDYTARANRNRMFVVRKLLGEADKPPSDYHTFEAAQMAALIQMAKLQDAEKALADAREPAEADAGFWASWAGKTRRLRSEVTDRKYRVLALLERARELATDKDPPADVTDNLLRLVYFYQSTDQPYQAAVLGEHVARTLRGSGGKAAAAGIMALGNYLLASNAVKVDVTDPAAAALAGTARQADRDRAIRIARFLDEKFPNDAPTDSARFRLAQLLAEEERFDQAFDAITRVRAGYAQLTNARQLEGYIATRLIAAQAKDVPMPPGGREAVFRRTVGDLERVVKPPPTALPDEARGYLLVRVRLAQLYLLQSKADPATEKASPGYDRAIRVADDVLGLIPAFDRLSGDDKKPNLDGLEMKLLGQDVRTRALFLRGKALTDEKKLDEAAAVLDPAVEEIKKTGALADAKMQKWAGGQGDGSDDEDTAAHKARIAGLAAGVDKVRREIVVAGFRLRLAQGKVPEAAGMLDLLEKTGGSVQSNQPTLEAMARELVARIPALAKEGKTNPAKAKEAADLKAGLGVLVKRLGSVPNLAPSSVLFLGQTLFAVEQYDEARKEFAKIAAPSRPDWAALDTATITDVTDRNKLQNEIRYYRFAQLYTAKCLRLSGKLAGAESLIAAAIGTAEKKGYAYGSLDFRKERAHLYEAKGAAAQQDAKAASAEWRKALDEWTTLFRIAEKQVKDLPADAGPEQARQVKSAYFDVYCDIQRVMIEANSQLLKDETKLAATFADIGKKIADMERANKIPQLEQEGKGIITAEVWNRYCDLIEKYIKLGDAYKNADGKFFLQRPKE